MKYIMLEYVYEAGWPQLTAEQKQHWIGVYNAYVEAMKEAGVFVSQGGLQPTATATTVRMAEGKARVLDGPYTDTKEQLGGFRIIEAPDLDTALGWAKKNPTALHGVVEVRPLFEMTLEEIAAAEGGHC